MADIKKLYHDGHNDKQSLQIKMEHYELRRGQKLEIVRQERMNIIRS